MEIVYNVWDSFDGVEAWFVLNWFGIFGRDLLFVHHRSHRYYE